MGQTSLNRIITEEDFARALAQECRPFFQLANTLRRRADPERARKHLDQMVIEADMVEAFLDDHGARYNRGFHFFRELVASIRGFSQAGFALAHLAYRFDGYRASLALDPGCEEEFRAALAEASAFVGSAVETLLEACREEAVLIGVQWDNNLFPGEGLRAAQVQLSLPRNLGEEALEEEGMQPSEIASKYLEVCSLFNGLGVRTIEDEADREAYLSRVCREEHARVFEATVHNLQSAYDTHFKDTKLELDEPRLAQLRGHASAAFHLLEAVTILAHFVERHEAYQADNTIGGRMNQIVQRSEVRRITLNVLLLWSQRLIEFGRDNAQALLTSFTNVKQLELSLPPDLVVHARPASLIVGIVNHHGTPVELEVGGQTANAGSILEVMIAVGSHPDCRTYLFRGDECPLRDIESLFTAGLGEGGLESLPENLAYLAT